MNSGDVFSNTILLYFQNFVNKLMKSIKTELTKYLELLDQYKQQYANMKQLLVRIIMYWSLKQTTCHAIVCRKP